MKKEYLTLDRIEGSLLELSNLHRVSYGEVVKIISKDGKRSEIGQVIKIDEDRQLSKYLATILVYQQKTQR